MSRWYEWMNRAVGERGLMGRDGDGHDVELGEEDIDHHRVDLDELSIVSNTAVRARTFDMPLATLYKHEELSSISCQPRKRWYNVNCLDKSTADQLSKQVHTTTYIH